MRRMGEIECFKSFHVVFCHAGFCVSGSLMRIFSFRPKRGDI